MPNTAPVKEHLKTIIWPRGELKTAKQKVFRYVVVGMLVTDEPIEGMEGKNQILLDGPVVGLVSKLTKIKKRQPNYHHLGDATNVVLSLNDI